MDALPKIWIIIFVIYFTGCSFLGDGSLLQRDGYRRRPPFPFTEVVEDKNFYEWTFPDTGVYYKYYHFDGRYSYPGRRNDKEILLNLYSRGFKITTAWVIRNACNGCANSSPWVLTDLIVHLPKRDDEIERLYFQPYSNPKKLRCPCVVKSYYPKFE